MQRSFNDVPFPSNIGYEGANAVSCDEVEGSLKNRAIYYFLRALLIIKSALRLLKSSAPFFEQYHPLLKQLPNMYKMIKLIQDVESEPSKDSVEHEDEGKQTSVLPSERSVVNLPTLFI